MVRVAQLVRASDCGSEGRGFEPLSSPQQKVAEKATFFCFPAVGAAGILNYCCLGLVIQEK